MNIIIMKQKFYYTKSWQCFLKNCWQWIPYLCWYECERK